MVDLDLLFIGACGVRDSDASAEHQDVLTRGRLRRQSRCPSANHTRRQTNKTTHLLLLLSLTVDSLARADANKSFWPYRRGIWRRHTAGRITVGTDRY